MKKLIIPMLILLMSFQAFGQRGEKMRERLKAQKVAFITERLDLSADEAQKFWPIYNAHEKEMEMLRLNSREKHHRINITSMTEEEARKALTEMVAFENEEHRLKTDLIHNLSTAISAKKIIQLRKAEWEFKKTVLEEMRKRRDKFRKNKP
jgi:LPS O-antigen subunit length determinant protein (WzzB/FepE family)